ncbi:hypothetical protein C8J57DRAFT_1241318 [Mycena rebaudengoi]|nr:hypothetical protein C8J57DRAFT_1241318 [Mycena rebaudengoi]
MVALETSVGELNGEQKNDQNTDITDLVDIIGAEEEEKQPLNERLNSKVELSEFGQVPIGSGSDNAAQRERQPSKAGLPVEFATAALACRLRSERQGAKGGREEVPIRDEWGDEDPVPAIRVRGLNRLCAVPVTGTAVVSTGSERVQPSRPRTVARLKNISTGRDGYRDGRHGPLLRALNDIFKTSNGDPTACTKNSNNMGTKMNTSLHFKSLRAGWISKNYTIMHVGTERQEKVFEAVGRVNLVFDAL